MKNKLLTAILVSTLLLSGCTAVDNGEYYSFNDIAGINTIPNYGTIEIQPQ